MKLVVVSNNPFPYHTPILNRLNELVDLHVIYMGKGHPLGSFKDDWGEAPTYSHSFYWSRALRNRNSDFRAQVSVGVSGLLWRHKPEVIVFSSWGPLVWEPVLWKKLTGRKAVMWAESTNYSGLLRGRFSDSFRSAVLANTDAFVSNGSQASAYLQQLGVSASQIVPSCLPSPLAPVQDHDNLGRSFDPASPRLLFVGRLVPLKRPVELVQEFGKVLESIPDATLSIVGDGPLRSDVIQAAARFGPRVRVLGRLEGDDLAEEYRQADIMVLPSVREVWGLVVNEALANGLFVVATDQVGAAHDLIDERSGVLIPAENLATLAPSIINAVRVLSDPNRTRNERAQRVACCTPASFAQDILKAAEIAVGDYKE